MAAVIPLFAFASRQRRPVRARPGEAGTGESGGIHPSAATAQRGLAAVLAFPVPQRRREILAVRHSDQLQICPLLPLRELARLRRGQALRIAAWRRRFGCDQGRWVAVLSAEPVGPFLCLSLAADHPAAALLRDGSSAALHSLDCRGTWQLQLAFGSPPAPSWRPACRQTFVQAVAARLIPDFI